MKTTLRVLLVGLLLLPFSASAQNATPTPDATKATVYFYRLREFYAEALKPSVFADKKQVARMRNGRFLSVQLDPGPHTITSTLPGSGLAIDLKAGGTYYVRLTMAHASFIHNARGEVALVPEEQGKFEVTQLKPADPDDLKDEAAK